MSYLAFHLIFILPPIALLILAQPQPLGWSIGGQRSWLSLMILALVALVYTTPWDNYLIWREVWAYGVDRVIGTIGYVPVEEYLFFLLQTILAGLWLYWILARQGISRQDESAATVVRIGVTGFWVALSIAGALMLQQDSSVYLGLILAWAGPILALQWGIGAKQIWAKKETWLIGTLVPTLYLWICDRVAIAQGIWHISERYTTGFQLWGLPVEEAAFFLVTNLLVVQGLLLLLLLGTPSKRSKLADV